jgi:beta-galactosidase
LLVFDPQGGVVNFLRRQSIPFRALSSLQALPANGRVLVIGKDALGTEESTSTQLASYAQGGRRVIVLEQKNPLRYGALPC